MGSRGARSPVRFQQSPGPAQSPGQIILQPGLKAHNIQCAAKPDAGGLQGSRVAEHYSLQAVVFNQVVYEIFAGLVGGIAVAGPVLDHNEGLIEVQVLVNNGLAKVDGLDLSFQIGKAVALKNNDIAARRQIGTAEALAAVHIEPVRLLPERHVVKRDFFDFGQDRRNASFFTGLITRVSFFSQQVPYGSMTMQAVCRSFSAGETTLTMKSVV